MMRLDRMLAECGLGTRNEVKKLIRSGSVSVSGDIVRNPAAKVDEEHDSVAVDGEEIVYRRFAWYMLNKPKGYVSSTEGADSVLNLIAEYDRNLFPCGRLDKDTEGLLLITNDGELAHELLSPKHHVEKEYLVTVKNPLKEEDLEVFRKGIVIDGEEACQPADYRITDTYECHLIIREGKYHQIKRMFAAIGNEVTGLKRLRMKNLVLDESLEPGDYRPLKEEELEDLRRRVPEDPEA